MNSEQFKELKDLLSYPRRIVVIPHKNADGDAMGSVLAAYHFLTKMGHNTSVISPNDYPEFLKWLPGSDKVLKFDSQNIQSKRKLDRAEFIFLMDFNDLSRVGDDMQKTLEAFKGTFIMIDHHIDPKPLTPFLFSDTSVCSTAQMFYHFLEKMDAIHFIDENMATCLYTGILTDTGSFRFPTTTPTTHRIVAELIEKGANNSEIYDQVFDQNSYHRMQLLGSALEKMVVLPEFATAYMIISKEQKSAFNFQKGDTEGFVNYTLSVKNINLGVIFIEDDEQDMIRISFRSKGSFSVNQFSRNHFEGGGHDNAAGGKSKLSLQETIEKFVNLLPQYKNQIIDGYNF
jgi:phosphoesterase RecJ-like protein